MGFLSCPPPRFCLCRWLTWTMKPQHSSGQSLRPKWWKTKDLEQLFWKSLRLTGTKVGLNVSTKESSIWPNMYKSYLYCSLERAKSFLLFGVWVNAGSNGHVTYGGVTEEGFVINPVTGVITTTKELDSEVQDHYTLTGTTVGTIYIL